MKIGPKYKIARRLGAPIFEKTQTQKFALRNAKKLENNPRPRSKSEFGLGMIEKQKARLTYGVNERQFSNYVKAALLKKGNTGELLISSLESRLDSVVLRAGFTTTRRAARQMTSHGHITVNGKIVRVPSMTVSIGDVIGIREGSKTKPLFMNLDERLKTVKLPAWLKLNFDKKEVTIDGKPVAQNSDLLFNVATVLEFYTR
jgi:small subunit ribosomal protein S4